jgi:hypothetical protein
MEECCEILTPNNCLTTLMRGEEQFKWRGPVIVTKEVRRTEIYRSFEGVAIRDIAAVIKYFAA